MHKTFIFGFCLCLTHVPLVGDAAALCRPAKRTFYGSSPHSSSSFLLPLPPSLFFFLLCVLHPNISSSLPDPFAALRLRLWHHRCPLVPHRLHTHHLKSHPTTFFSCSSLHRYIILSVEVDLRSRWFLRQQREDYERYLALLGPIL